MRSVLHLFLLASLVAACEQQPSSSGEPLVRTSIRQTGTGAQMPAAGSDIAPNDALAAQVESSCRSVIFENVSFAHCLAVPSRHRIETELQGADGRAFTSFAAYAAAHPQNSGDVAFAMNGGAFGSSARPVGYFVQDGARIQVLNTDDGEDDFSIKPSGVFFGDGQQWQIVPTQRFLDEVKERPDFGTQSGPMLVVDGQINRNLPADGGSLAIRNAVGVDAEGRAHFVISNAPVGFDRLARLYRDKLEVANALALDGEVSSLWSPASGRLDAGSALGPLIVVRKRDTAP